MKTETIKQKKLEAPEVTVDPALDKLFEGKVLFPKKLAQANEFLAKYPLPDHLSKRKS